MLLTLLKNIREKLFSKAFLGFTVIIFALAFAVSLLLFHYQSQPLKNHWVEEGKMLASFFSYNSRLGVFSGKTDDLRKPAEWVLQNQDVQSASVLFFKNNDKRELIKWRQNEENEARVKVAPDKLKRIVKLKIPFSIDQEDKVEFWAPVFDKNLYTNRDELLYPEFFIKNSESSLQGYVSVTLSKNSLNKSLEQLWFHSMGIGFSLVLFGLFADYLYAKRGSLPIRRMSKKIGYSLFPSMIEDIPGDINKRPGDDLSKISNAFAMAAKNMQLTNMEKHNLETELLHFQKMATLGSVAGAMAHNFANILNIAYYQAEALQSVKSKEGSEKILKQMLSLTSRSLNQVDMLKQFSRKQDLNPKPMDVNKIISETLNLVNIFLNKTIQIETNLSDEPLNILADYAHMEQMLMNLISNARDAILTDTGTIYIQTEAMVLEKDFFKNKNFVKPGRYALISVTDTGCGIEKANLDKIFDTFFSTKKVKGMGFGLPIVLWTVKQYNGIIDVQSKVNKGANFRVYLPLIDKDRV